ncbi:hypothetical protein HX848_06930 [Marine Group I thaumarchaeote]|uniref:Uncharacterized protein n=1 Tax=Marine Group I thaumarchaeote TaxID=2511932 RepID=A0A7K4MIS6_9ARCH|nr:hypothetical protein [Marine Group I thaumarchaeote]
MYKIAALGMLGVLVILLIPASSDASTPISPFYGSATLMLLDEYGQEKFSQTIHNQIFDEGEDYLLDQVFKTIGGIATVDNVQIGAICAAAGTPSTDETDGLSDINSDDNSSTMPRCMTDDTVTKSGQIATIAVTFVTGTNWTDGETISHISVCSAHASDTAVNDCVGTMFAVVDTSNVTPTGTETVTVTYKFDISSSST